MSAAIITLPAERIQSRIVVLRGQRVLLDADLAAIYEVPTRQLNQAVKRNFAKFPEDFVFQLTKAEAESMRSRSQSVTLYEATASDRGKNIKYLPYAFTEHGAIQAANVLRSNTAIEMSVQVVRAFVQLRQLMVNHKAIAAKLVELDARIGAHDEQLAAIIEAIRLLRSASPALRRAPRRRAPALRYGAARFARDHLRASRSVSEPVLPEKRRHIGFPSSAS